MTDDTPDAVYRLLISGRDRDLVIDALRSAANQRRRAASRVAGQLTADRAAGKDVRSAAVRVVDTLGEAFGLDTVADTLEALEPTEDPTEDDTTDPPDPPVTLDGPGLDLDDIDTIRDLAAAEPRHGTNGATAHDDEDEPSDDEAAESLTALDLGEEADDGRG